MPATFICDLNHHHDTYDDAVKCNDQHGPFTTGYRLGFETGREVGRLQLDHDLTEQDRKRTAYMRGLANSPAYAELERRRWNGPRNTFGQPRPGDFPGFGASYKPRSQGA